MIQNKFGELVFSESDIVDLVMQGYRISELDHMVVDSNVNLKNIQSVIENPEDLLTWKSPSNDDQAEQDFHFANQQSWRMPDEYKQLDIAELVLNLCTTQEELQRCGAELMLYQERDLFDLLRYLKYLVDIMRKNQIIWGVGRGSSVASFVLYKLGVHRINSLYYNLDIEEFLR